MSSFEGMRSRTSGAARGWRFARYLPLYLAGIVAGAGIGLGLTLLAGGDETPVVTRTASPSLQVIGAPAFDAPTIVWPTAFPVELAIPSTAAIQVPAAVPDAAPLAEPEAAPILQSAPVAAPSSPGAPAPAPAANPPATANPPSAIKPIEQPAPAPPAPAPVETSNFYLPGVAGGGASNLEQRLLDGINAQRAANGLGAYTYDSSLSKVARTRSQQMADQGYFGHVDPHGYSMYTELLQRFGIGYAWAGENLALNNYGAGESPERAIVSLMKSPTHAANILASDFYRVGIGEVTTADGRHIYAMIFVG